MPLLYPLFFLQLQTFIKKNLVVLKEFVEHNSLNKLSKYKFYEIKDLLSALHLAVIFSHSEQDFWTLIFLHRAQYFFATHSQRSFWKRHASQMRCFVHFPLQFLASLQELHFRLYTQIPHLPRAWQGIHFNVSHTNRTPPDGNNLFSTYITLILFCTVVDLPIAEFMVIVNISCIINYLFRTVYQPAQRKTCWPPGFLFIFATCNACFA